VVPYGDHGTERVNIPCKDSNQCRIDTYKEMA
jgi:hypothetical protein